MQKNTGYYHTIAALSKTRDGMVLQFTPGWVANGLVRDIVTRVVEKQARYLQCRHENVLAPFLQIELAKEMNVHPSIISRATEGLCIQTPWGEDKPLKTLFVSDTLRQREPILHHIRSILREEKAQLRQGALLRPFSDEAIARQLRDKYAVSISKRTVAKYRNLLQLPGAFHRLRT